MFARHQGFSALSSVVGLGLLLGLGGCSAAGAQGSASDEPESSDDAIVDVVHTPVERQSVGNCWIYAESTWLESMHLAATGESFDDSQSYRTYWHWYEQIVGGSVSEISTGGNWSTANGLITRYGLVSEKDFLAADTENEMSFQQSEAEEAMNEELKNGSLKKASDRRNKAKVRAALDAAFGVSEPVQTYMTKVFGKGFTKNLTSKSRGRETADVTGTPIVRPRDFAVSYAPGPGKAPEKKTLDLAMREWRETYYFSGNRSFQQRVQRALHDAQPVVISWFVDFNALESRPENPLRGSFNMTTLNELGPGHQGWHMVVMEDYEAKLSDGTLLKAGTTLDKNKPEDRALLTRALETRTELVFFRIKNSWGTARPDRGNAPGFPGYHDLYLDYLNGPVKECDEDGENCNGSVQPLSDAVLPPGY